MKFTCQNLLQWFLFLTLVTYPLRKLLIFYFVEKEGKFESTGGERKIEINERYCLNINCEYDTL